MVKDDQDGFPKHKLNLMNTIKKWYKTNRNPNENLKVTEVYIKRTEAGNNILFGKLQIIIRN